MYNYFVDMKQIYQNHCMSPSYDRVQCLTRKELQAQPGLNVGGI